MWKDKVLKSHFLRKSRPDRFEKASLSDFVFRFDAAEVKLPLNRRQPERLSFSPHDLRKGAFYTEFPEKFPCPAS